MKSRTISQARGCSLLWSRLPLSLWPNSYSKSRYSLGKATAFWSWVSVCSQRCWRSTQSRPSSTSTRSSIEMATSSMTTTWGSKAQLTSRGLHLYALLRQFCVDLLALREEWCLARFSWATICCRLSCLLPTSTSLWLLPFRFASSSSCWALWTFNSRFYSDSSHWLQLMSESKQSTHMSKRVENKVLSRFCW